MSNVDALREQFKTLEGVINVAPDIPEKHAFRAGLRILESLAINLQRIADAQEAMANAYLNPGQPANTVAS